MWREAGGGSVVNVVPEGPQSPMCGGKCNCTRGGRQVVCAVTVVVSHCCGKTNGSQAVQATGVGRVVWNQTGRRRRGLNA